MSICRLLADWIHDYPHDFAVRDTAGALSALVKSIIAKTHLIHYGLEFLPFLEVLPNLVDQDTIWALKVEGPTYESDDSYSIFEEDEDLAMPARTDLWKTSGHAGYYAQNMFTPMELDDAEYQLKPMNCPGHILIYRDRQHSYRDLPVRLGELGTVYRYERSGTMHGLMRVRGFTQDDAHIFCTAGQIENEIVSCLEFAADTLKTFGFNEYKAEISTWDGGVSGKYDGEKADWELAEGALRKACDRLGIHATLIPDEAAFYGPKIDVKLVDAIGRHWQLSTVQFDSFLPRRFELEYIAEDGKKHRPLMVHRALFGSVERFFGILIEHYAGAFPVWLAPVQAAILPITDRQAEYAHQVAERLKTAGVRVSVDDRSEKVNLKIRDAQMQKVPYMLVTGGREADAGQVAVRHRKRGDLGPTSVEEFIRTITAEIAGRSAD
jgi:threonyl-tRNA synthetase